MKLRNKQTGEIKPAEAREDGIYLYDETTEQWYKYELDLLAKWWEYYEEPKKYWYITGEGDICRDDIKHSEWIEERKQIGNYFETKEEDEKAVEKLKAWKRLKDRGFRFTGYTSKDRGTITEFEIYCDTGKPCIDRDEFTDLDLLFGGEE